MPLKINVNYSPVSSGLVLLLDADNKNSYSGTGTTWYDLSGSNNHFTLSGLTWDDSGFFNLTNTGAASITGGITAATGCTVGFYIKSTDTQSLFLSNTSTAYLGAYRSGNKFYNGLAGTPTLKIDNVSRANIYDFFPDGNWHYVEFKSVNFSNAAWATTTWFNNYGSYTFSDGAIGKILVYDRVLTDAESLTNYERLSGCWIEMGAMKVNLDTNIEDYSDWVVGGATTNGFQPWAAVQTNISRVSGSDPFGATNVLWDVIGTGSNPTFYAGNSGYTYGGMTGKLYQPVDQTKIYRYSLWVNRVSSGDTAAPSGERFYYGLYNYNQSYTNTGATYITSGAYGTNIYFFYQTPVLSTRYPINTWQLLVAHMFPYTWTGTTNHPNSGIWRNGENIGGLNGDVKFNFNTYYTSMRCYAPYVGGRYCHYQLAYPRLDCVDGTEPSIETLLNNEGPWRNVVGGWINIGDSWKRFLEPPPVVANILVVGSGGAGNQSGYYYNPYAVQNVYFKGNGGGGGQVVYTTGITLSATTYSIVVGALQAGGNYDTTVQSNSSSFSGTTAVGGFSGYKYNGGKSGSNRNGGADYKVGGTCSGVYGGGGAGDAVAGSAPKGGNGTSNSITGSAVYYAGGGKGGYSSDPGNSLGYDGYGAGGAGNNSACSPSGGSNSIQGVVIIRYTSATQRATGGNSIVQSGGDWIHTFTTSGNFVVS